MSQYISYSSRNSGGGGGGGTVTDINGATGPTIDILGGTGIDVTTVGNNITITNTGITPTGSINTFAGFDGSGDLESVPGFGIDTTTGGLNEQLLERPNNTNNSYSANNLNVNFIPLQNSPNESWNIQQITAALDLNSTGFSQGTSGTAVNALSLYVNHLGTGNVGGLNQISSYFNIGNGTDPFTMKGMAYMFGFADINSGVTIDGVFQGFDFQPHIHTGVITTSNFSSYAFADALLSDIAINSHNSFQSNFQTAGISNNHNYQGVALNPAITTLTGNASYYGVGVNGTVTTMGASSNIAGLQFSPTITTSHGNIYGANLSPTVNGGDANFIGLNIALGGTATGLQTVRGVTVRLTNVPTTDPLGPISFEADSRINVNAVTEVISAQGFMIGNRLEGLLHSSLGSPVTGTDSLGNDLAGDLWFEDNVADGPTAGLVGQTGVGFISTVVVGSGKVVDTANVFLVGSSLADPGAGHTFGGTITNLSMIKTAPPLNQGGALLVTNYKAINIAGDFVGFGATNTWGLFIEDTVLNNYIPKLCYVDGVTSLDTLNGFFQDSTGTTSLIYNTARQLVDVTSATSLDWATRQLIATDGATPVFDWSASGVLDAKTNLISNVIDPVSPQDAATKAYVDASGGGGTEVCGIYDLTLGNYTIAADAVIKYDTVTYESHPGAYSTGTGLFTVPSGQGGRYRVSVVLDVTTGGGTIYASVNGVNKGYLTALIFTATTVSGSRVYNLAAGDTIGIFGDTIAQFLANSPSVNNFSIEKI